MSTTPSREDYIKLGYLAVLEPQLARILNENGGANITCCPECRVDDFVHVEGCSVGKAVDGSIDF